jgi:hypothetical protein
MQDGNHHEEREGGERIGKGLDRECVTASLCHMGCRRYRGAMPFRLQILHATAPPKIQWAFSFVLATTSLLLALSSLRHQREIYRLQDEVAALRVEMCDMKNNPQRPEAN